MVKYILISGVLIVILMKIMLGRVAVDEQKNLSDVVQKLSDYNFVEFEITPSADERKYIESVVRRRLEIIYQESLVSSDFVWNSNRLYYKVAPYKEHSLLRKYLNIQGDFRFHKVSVGGEIEIEIPAEFQGSFGKNIFIAKTPINAQVIGIKQLESTEPEFVKYSFKYSEALDCENLVFFINDMFIGIGKVGYNELEILIPTGFEKLVNIIQDTDAFPVRTAHTFHREDYTIGSDAWFPVPEELRKKLLENRKKFVLEPLSDVPVFEYFESALKSGCIKIPKTRGYVCDAEIFGKNKKAIVVEGLINLQSGYIEVAASNSVKLHETLIDLDVSMVSLDLAITLCGIKRGSKEDADSRAVILVQWRAGNKQFTYRLEDLLIDAVDEKTMDRVGWYYQYKVYKREDPLRNKVYEVPISFFSRLIATTVRTAESVFDNPLPDKIAMDNYRYISNVFLVPESGTKILFIIFKSDEGLINVK
ncbi:MAG: hypothetical protein HY606_00455 [Planctomycetes bacterium]|nr:hypothetical protein [Planctomycetota bacterium]